MNDDWHYILLPQGGVERWAVSAGTSGKDHTELHGGFKSYDEARSYADALRKEFSDYSYVEVTEIRMVRP